MSNLPRRLALVTLLGLLVLSGCGSDTMPRQAGGRSMDVKEAAQVAGFELPAAAQPIAAYQRQGIDRLVAFAVRLPPGELGGLFSGSGFSEELRPGRRVFQEPVPGVDVDAARSVAAAQDRQRVGGREVVRDVLVVTDDPSTTLVHVWAFTT